MQGISCRSVQENRGERRPAAYKGGAKGGIYCSGPADVASIHLCGQEWVPQDKQMEDVKCEGWSAGGTTSRYFTFSCTHGLAIRSYVWDYLPGFDPPNASTASNNVTCSS